MIVCLVGLPALLPGAQSAWVVPPAYPGTAEQRTSIPSSTTRTAIAVSRYYTLIPEGD